MTTHDKPNELATQETDMETSPTKPIAVKKTRHTRPLRRMETAWRSFRILKNLSKEQVDNFMASYIIYDLDWADEKTMTETLGPDYQKKVGECLRDYYSVLNHMCAIGELEKMYIPPAMDLNANLITNQNLYEASIASELQLPPNAKILDLGCGRGRVAAHIHHLTGASITGLNIDADQISSARLFNAEKNYPNTFLRADFNDLPLPFPAAHFDAFYQIQAFSLCKDPRALCRELHRVLKPGARLSLLDWARLEAFDESNPHHRDLMRKIKPMIGAIGTPTPQSLAADLEAAGFRVVRAENASLDGLQAPLIERADGYFRAARTAVLGGVKVGVLPGHFKTLFERFTKDCDAFVEADRKRLVTMSFHWVAEKPEVSAAKEESPVSSERTTNTATSDSTGITEPPTSPPEDVVKRESLSANAPIPVASSP